MCRLEMQRAGFKEWAVVCQALGAGRQSIILRKGGIAEGRDGFSFRHREFFLFPTWFHEQPAKVREWHGLDGLSENAERPTVRAGLAQNAEHRSEERVIPPESDSMLEIRYAAKLETFRTITLWEVAEALEPLHILKSEVIRERFEYDAAPGLHVAFVRVYRLDPVWRFPNQRKYGGCRSWVDLPETPNDLQLEAVLDETEHSKRFEEFVMVVDDQLTKDHPSL